MVIAIEALPSNYDIMLKNISANRVKNITPIQTAIWKDKNEIDFSVTKKNSINSKVIDGKQVVKIEADTVDNILKSLNIENIDFIRI